MVSTDLKLNFYDEVISISFPKTYDFFKKEIARLYAIDASDVEELIVYYFDNSKVKVFIKSESDFIQFMNFRQMQMTIFLEIHEESKLFKKEKINSSNSDVEKLRKEIIEKEEMLKLVIEKEKLEIKRKKEEEKLKIIEEENRRKLENLRLRKTQIEHEENMRRLDEKRELEAEVSRIMSENIDKLKETILKNAVSQSLLAIDKQNEKKLQYSLCKDVHKGIQCSSCNCEPIIGVRYQCPINPKINFCESCELLIGDSYQYPLLKIRTMQQGKINIKVVEVGSEQQKNRDDFILINK